MPSDGAARALPWRWILATALRWWIMTRLGVALLLWGVATLFTPNPGTFTPSPSLARSSVTPLQALLHLRIWDSAIFYLPIALHGYTRQAEAAFWPLYPLLIRLGLTLTAPLGAWDSTHALIVALVISNLAAFAAFAGVVALAYQEFGRRALAGRALQALALSPFAFWLALPYTDGLFLALAAFTLLALRRERWLLVGALSFWAALARPTFAALALVVVATTCAELWRQARRGRRLTAAMLIPRFAALEGGPLGAAVWLGYCASAFPQWGGWSAPLRAASAKFGHHFSPGGAWESLTAMAHDLAVAPHLGFATTRLLADLAPWLVSAALCVIAFTGVARKRAGRIAWPLALYATAVTALTAWSPLEQQLFNDPLVSAGRYALAAAPLALVWVSLTRSPRWGPWLRTLEVAVAPALQALLLAFVLLGGWLV